MILTNIPAPRVPFVDDRTGLVSREWYRFLSTLYTNVNVIAAAAVRMDQVLGLGAGDGGGDGTGGEQGPPGVQGLQGSQGPAGFGMMGESGEDGAFGPPGVTGAQGATGIAGISVVLPAEDAGGIDFYMPPGVVNNLNFLAVAPTQKVFFDGLNGEGDTYIVESAANVMDLYAGAAKTLSLSATTAAVTGALTVSGNATLGDATTDAHRVNGYVGVGGAGAANASMNIVSSVLTGTAQYGIVSNVTFSSAATTSGIGVWSSAYSAAAVYTMPDGICFNAAAGVKGAGSTITNMYGVYIADQTVGANNYGLRSVISAGALKWNIYASGNADNAYAGNSRFGGVTAPVATVDVTGTVATTGGAWFGAAALATGATTGHVYIRTSAGAPTGVPATKTGQVAIQYDTTNNFLYIYNGGWKKSTVYA